MLGYDEIETAAFNSIDVLTVGDEVTGNYFGVDFTGTVLGFDWSYVQIRVRGDFVVNGVARRTINVTVCAVVKGFCSVSK